MKTLNALLATMMLFVITHFTYAAEQLSPEWCKTKVQKAADLIKNKGPDAFAIIRNPQGEFCTDDGEGYVWVHDLNSVIIVNPVKPILEGRCLVEFKDPSGKRIFAAFNKVAENYGQGWVEYTWPKPGKLEASPKISYIMLVDGTNYVVGAGVFDLKADDIAKKFPTDYIQKADD